MISNDERIEVDAEVIVLSLLSYKKITIEEIFFDGDFKESLVDFKLDSINQHNQV